MLGLQVCHLLTSLAFPELCDGAGEGGPGASRTLNTQVRACCYVPSLYWSLLCFAVISPCVSVIF